MLEKTIEKKVSDHAKNLGVWTRKFVSPNNRGVPDRIFAYRGRVLFIEFKAPGKEPTPLQVGEMRKMRAVGLDVRVCDNADAGKEIIDFLVMGLL